MFRIVYISRNLLPPEVADAEVERILAAARRNNAAAGVTGALLFSEDAFAQVLEGPAAAVSEVFEAIQADLRHDEVVVLEAGPAPRREFGDWRMAYAGRTADAAARFGAMLGEGPGAGAGERVLGLLRRVVDGAAPAAPCAAAAAA